LQHLRLQASIPLPIYNHIIKNGATMHHLPGNVPALLATADHKASAGMARHSDILWDACASESTVSSITAPIDAFTSGCSSPRDKSHRNSLVLRQGKVPLLTAIKVAATSRRSNPGLSGGGRRNYSLCYHHAMYGTKAHNSWTEN
jgi:hypothetical protein